MEEHDSQTERAIEISEKVMALMERRGIQKHKFSSELRRILDIGPTTAFRKLKGYFAWSIDQVDLIAAEYGVDPLTLLTQDEKREASVPSIFDENEYEATLITESPRISCMAKIGSELETSSLPFFVAAKDGNDWNIYSSKNAPTGKTLFNVESININVKQPVRKPTIAVVDDDQGVVNTLCAYLGKSGFTPMRFYDLASFREESRKTNFDGYVFDWLLDDTTTETDILRIRTCQDSDVPIIVLTGKLNTGLVKESDIANVVRKFNVTNFEKPVRLPILHATLSQSIGKNSDYYLG